MNMAIEGIGHGEVGDRSSLCSESVRRMLCFIIIKFLQLGDYFSLI